MEISITTLIVIGFFGLWALITVLTSFVITQQKTSKVLTLFGKYYKCTRPGLSMKPPWPFVIQKDSLELNIQELKGEVDVKSSDNAFLTIPWALQFKVIASKVKEAYYELDEPRRQMKSYIVNTIRGKASDLTMQQLFQSNEGLELAANEALTKSFDEYGYEIVNVLVDDPQPSKELKTAFDKVIASKREKEAASNEAEAIRVKMVGEAEAEGESLKIKARAFKEFRKEIAEGNSDAIKAFLTDIEDGKLNSKDVLNFFEGVDLRDAIRDASKNKGSLVVVPVDFQSNLTLPIPKGN